MKTRFQANTGLRRLTATITNADVDDVQLFDLPRDTLVIGTLLGVKDAPAAGATLKVGYKGGTETELVNLVGVGANTYSAATISAAAVDKSYNDSASGFPVWILPGDTIVVSGFTGNAGNNGTKTVVSATPAKIVIRETLVDDAAGETVTIQEAVGAQQLVMPPSPVTTDRVRTIVATLSDKTLAAEIEVSVLFALLKDTPL